MDHFRKPEPGHLHREGFDLTGPDRCDAVTDGRQRETADAIKQAAHGKAAGWNGLSKDLISSEPPDILLFFRVHFATACTMARVVFTADWTA